VSRTTRWLLGAGILLFIALLASQGFSGVVHVLSLAGWALLPVALFHLLPLAIDAAAIRVLEPTVRPHAMRDALLVRWIGESANSLLPVGALGGPLLMVRQFIQRGMPGADAVAIMTVSTTLQTFAHMVFALLGLAVLGGRLQQLSNLASWAAIAVSSALIVVAILAFYVLQRRGLFGRVIRLLQRLVRSHDWSDMERHAAGADLAITATYARTAQVWRAFLLNLAGWLVGTAEVWMLLDLLGSPVSWAEALALESVGSAIRGAGFAIPGSLGVQEGGYLLLAPLLQLRPDVALAVSLGKRARELLLGLPGMVYLHFSEHNLRSRGRAATG
jgi:putative membrane protein